MGKHAFELSAIPAPDIGGYVPKGTVNQTERAARLWPFLVAKATDRKTVSYSEAAKHIGIHPRPIRFVLEVILNYCLDTGKPLLTAIVVSELTGRPGSGLQARAPQLSDRTLDEVFEHPWAREPNPFAWAVIGTTDQDIQALLLAVPSRATEAYALVKVRGMMQIQFRKALLVAYEGVCSFSGIAIPETLEAAHIVPWSCCESVPVSNGTSDKAAGAAIFDLNLERTLLNTENPREDESRGIKQCTRFTCLDIPRRHQLH